MSDEAQRLPHVDEHSVEVEAGASAVWDALLHVAERSMSAPGAPRFARLLGTADVRPAGPRPLAEGSAFTGFHVAQADPPVQLALVGSHRFSVYALVFRIDDLGGERTRLRAETRAEFPGLKGGVYRTLVIRTRGHVLVVRRVLGATKRRAER